MGRTTISSKPTVPNTQAKTMVRSRSIGAQASSWVCSTIRSQLTKVLWGLAYPTATLALFSFFVDKMLLALLILEFKLLKPARAAGYWYKLKLEDPNSVKFLLRKVRVKSCTVEP